jgi:hypothetical protein
MVTAYDLLAEQLRDMGASGLANKQLECGCSVQDMHMCDTISLKDCVPAKMIAIDSTVCRGKSCGWRRECGDGCYAPIDKDHSHV